MKLKLSAQHDIQILTATESVSAKDIQVLRAGISKLFHNGKNKIVLELPAGVSISDEAIRELSILDVLARELSGRIVLFCGDAATRTRVQNFAKPPQVLSVASLQDAIAAFAPVPLDAAPKEVAPPVAPAPAIPPAAAKPVPTAAPTPAPTSAPAEAPETTISQKEELRARELGDVGSLRKKVSQLETENKILQQQLSTLIWERRQPGDQSELQARIQTLEAELEKLLGPAGGGASKSR